MRAITTVVVASLTATAAAHAEQCTPNHELYRIVPEFRAVLLDGGNIKRVMFVDWKDERISTWKPGHNITFCPDENKMINTTINSVVRLLPEFATTCKPLLISDYIDRSLQTAWDYANKGDDRSIFVTAAESDLGWYYKVCTDHEGAWLKKDDFKNFLYTAAILTRGNMAVEDPANSSTYMERAAKYERWRQDLYSAESKKSWLSRIWQWWHTN
jgi:hypothetical protein